MSFLPRQPRASFYTLGCRVNQSETRVVAEDLIELGYRIVPFGQPADVCVVNTCSVTDQADVKSRSVLRRAARAGEDPLVIATGCYADVAPAAVSALPGVAAVVPNAEKPRLAEIVHDTLLRSGRLLFPVAEAAVSELAAGGELLTLGEGTGLLARTRAVIKVQDGCNHFCSFCIIPFARGRLRSRPAAEVLAEARALVDRGYRELVLAGICLGDFGDEKGYARSTREDPLAALLRDLDAIPGLARVRLSSIDPADVSDDLIEAMATVSAACRHLHLSLQAGDEEVLRRMRRRYTAAEFAALVERLRARVPGLALTTDVIVGFPGETEAQWENTMRLCERARFMKLHVFPYSPRSGTQAARWPDDVSKAEKERRSRVLQTLSNRLAYEFAAAHVGEQLEVLVEARDRRTGLLGGLTDNFLRVELEGEDDLQGELLRVHAVSAGEGGLFGEAMTGDARLHLLPNRER